MSTEAVGGDRHSDQHHTPTQEETMSTTTTITLRACPTGCTHEGKLKEHEIALEGPPRDLRPVVQHEIHFGDHVYGDALDNLLTGERQVSVGFIDLDDIRHTPSTPEGLRKLAATILEAADWIEANR